MLPRLVPCLFALLLIAMTLLSGCSGEEEPVAAPPPATRTPTTAPTTVPPPALSPACQDLLSSADADVTFMNALSDHIIYTRVHALAYENCARGPAAGISKNLADGPRPKTPALASARGFLLLAAGYCFEPEEGTAVSRTKDDLNSYIGTMGEYCALVHGCMGQFEKNASAPLKKAAENQGCILISGTGNRAQYLQVRTDGQKVFSMSSPGGDAFSVALTDPRGKKTMLHDSTAGPFSGVKTEDLEQGTYRIEVAAGGPWTVSVFNP